jgi:hypothetical protein
MNDADEKLTKLTGNVIAAVSAQVRHLVDVGLVEPDKLRLTIEARREKVKELLGAGMSQRDAAAALGVAHTTVQRDLAQSVPEGGTERAASDRDERREAALIGSAGIMRGMEANHDGQGRGRMDEGGKRLGSRHPA